MAGSVNKVTLEGNLGRDPEIRTMESGKKVANLSVATNETFTHSHTGEELRSTEWHRVVIFNEKLIKTVQKCAKKGSSIFVEGRLQTRKYLDHKGVEKGITEIVLQPFRGAFELLGPPKKQVVNAGAGKLSDEIPF